MNPWQPWTAAQADALRMINAPLTEALQAHREAAESLAALAEQMSAMAEQVGTAARQQAEMTRLIEAALHPYREYLGWLDSGR